MIPIGRNDALLFREMFGSGERAFESRFSQSGKRVIAELEHSGIVKRSRVGTRSWSVIPLSLEGFHAYIKTYHGITDLDSYISALELENPGRGDLASLGVSTKLKKIGPRTGMHISAPYPLKIVINGVKIDVSYPIGTALFVYEGSVLAIPEDAIVVGVENFTNLTHAAAQKHLFVGYKNILFCERSKMLQSLLSSIPNQYIHFGDIDLAGIHIYQTEYLPIVGDRGSFFLPCGLEKLFERYAGISSLYEGQLNKYRLFVGANQQLQAIVSAIHGAKKGIEQESFIGPFL